MHLTVSRDDISNEEHGVGAVGASQSSGAEPATTEGGSPGRRTPGGADSSPEQLAAEVEAFYDQKVGLGFCPRV